MRIVAMLLMLVLAACVELNGSAARRTLVPPRVTVETLLALPQTGSVQTYRVSLLIDNMSTEPLKLRGLEFKLRIAAQGILDGSSAVPITVPALDRQMVTVDIQSEILSSVSRLMSFVQGPANALPYEIYGTLTPERKLKDPIFFSATGEVPLAMTSER
jgi:hypothetical protein